jgi:hypothetical protein
VKNCVLSRAFRAGKKHRKVANSSWILLCILNVPVDLSEIERRRDA